MSAILPSDVREVYLQQVSAAADEVLDHLIERADALLAAWLGLPLTTGGDHTLASSTYTLYLEGDPLDRDLLRVPLCAVTAVSSIYDDPARQYASASLVSSSDYELITIGRRQVVRGLPTGTHAVWSTGSRAIKATVTAGWTSTTIPYDVRHAWSGMVAHLWTLRARQGLASAVIEGLQTTYRPETVPAHVQQALWPWRIDY